MSLKSYRDLEVWQTAIELVEAIYRVTSEWPAEERFGLVSQARRSAVSVPANIAEGYARLHRGDYLHHLSIARGSLAELDTHLIVAHRLGFITKAQVSAPWSLSQRVGKMLTRHIQSLSKSTDVRMARRTRNPKPETQSSTA